VTLQTTTKADKPMMQDPHSDETGTCEPIEDVRAFLFDLDGVLWDSNAMHAAVFAQVCAEYELTMCDYSRLAGLSTPKAFGRILEMNGVGDRHSLGDLTERKRLLFQERITEIPSEHLALISALSARRPEYLALVTGASRRTASAFLSRLPADFFDVVITGEDGLPSKPAPEAYLAAAERLGVAPEECVVFEDSSAGLLAAKAAGARVVHITFAWDGRCDGDPCDGVQCVPTLIAGLQIAWGESCRP